MAQIREMRFTPCWVWGPLDTAYTMAGRTPCVAYPLSYFSAYFEGVSESAPAPDIPSFPWYPGAGGLDGDWIGWYAVPYICTGD